MNYLGQGVQKLECFKQTDRQTDATEHVTTAHSQVVMIQRHSVVKIDLPRHHSVQHRYNCVVTLIKSIAGDINFIIHNLQDIFLPYVEQDWTYTLATMSQLLQARLHLYNLFSTRNFRPQIPW